MKYHTLNGLHIMVLIVFTNLLLLFIMSWLALTCIHALAGIVVDIFKATTEDWECYVSAMTRHRLKKTAYAILALAAMSMAAFLIHAGMSKLMQHIEENSISTRYERYVN